MAESDSSSDLSYHEEIPDLYDSGGSSDETQDDVDGLVQVIQPFRFEPEAREIQTPVDDSQDPQPDTQERRVGNTEW